MSEVGPGKACPFRPSNRIMVIPTVCMLLAGAIFDGSELQRPSNSAAADPHPEVLRVMTYNIWYVFAHGEEIEAGKEWVDSQTPDVVALQELTHIRSETLQGLADGWGHPHSSLLKTSGFSVGLTSRWPIEVVEKRLEGMHHGYLHAKTAGVHYFAVHLSPFRWEVRTAEADILLGKIRPLLDAGERVVVLGDFNANTVADKEWLEADADWLAARLKSDTDNDHVQNLKDGRPVYGAMRKFLSAGLRDTITPGVPLTVAARSTFPTGVSGDKATAPSSGQRIDYILVDKGLFGRLKRAWIPRDGVVNRTSDHYPVIADFGSSVRD